MTGKFLSAISIGAMLAAVPAQAVTNLIVNGSFEDGLNGFTHVVTAGETHPAVVINYGPAAAYPAGAFGEAVAADTSTSNSPDAVGGHAAYFVDDNARGESLRQLTFLQVGNYEIGFSAYLPKNGFNNSHDATLSGKIIGVTVASFAASSGTAQKWVNYSGVAQITQAGYYLTSFDFSSFGAAAKDFVIDRVYAIATDKPATVIIPPTPTTPVPEPATWALFIVGFALVGAAQRRRIGAFAA